MAFGKDVFRIVDELNSKEKKSKQDMETLDDAVREIMASQSLTDRLCSTLESGAKWNPFILSAFSKYLVSKCQAEGLDQAKKETFLLLLKSNHRGKWSTDLCRGLSFLLKEDVPEAPRILRSVIEKPRSQKERDIWNFYENNFASTLSPMGGLPYLLKMCLEIWPEPVNQQLQIVLANLIDKFKNRQIGALIKQAEEAFSTYLEKRSLNESKPFDLYERPLLELLRNQNVPAWEGYFQIIERHQPCTSGIGNAMQQERRVRPQTTSESRPNQRPEGEATRPASQHVMRPEPAKTEVLDVTNSFLETDILEPLDQSQKDFIRNLSVVTSEYKRLKEEYRKKIRALEKRDEKVMELTEAQWGLQSENSALRQKISDANDALQKLEEEKEALIQKCEEAEKRADERVHQIKIQANNELLAVKHSLWTRLRPDLEDLLREGITEQDYATPDRGRSLFRRFQDVIRSLTVLEIIPQKK